ncbi:MAG: hypothetical protein ACLPV2_04510 [Steroidobacteraceae bacterium]
MAAKKPKKLAHKPVSKEAARIEAQKRGIELLVQRQQALEYLAEYMLEKHLSTCTPEDAEDLAVNIVQGAEKQHRILLIEFIGKIKGYRIAARKLRKDQRLQ